MLLLPIVLLLPQFLFIFVEFLPVLCLLYLNCGVVLSEFLALQLMGPLFGLKLRQLLVESLLFIHQLLQLLGMEMGMKPMPSGSTSSAASSIRTAMPYDIVTERF